MKLLEINPYFHRLDRAISFPAKELNYLMEEGQIDTFDWYQGCFNVFSYMKLTKKLTHRIHWLKSLPLVWQPSKSCVITPAGAITSSSDTVAPCPAVALVSHCNDELLNSCFEGFLNWSGQGPYEPDENGARLIGQLTKKIIRSFIKGAKVTLAAGQLHDYSTLFSQSLFNDRLPKKIEDLFSLTLGTCRGWVETMRQKAKESGMGHLNISGILSATDFDGTTYIGGDICQKLRAVKEESESDLRCIVDEGIVFDDEGNEIRPLYLVTTYLYRALVKKYEVLCESPLCLDPSFKKMPCTYNGQTREVLHLDGIPIIPFHLLNEYEKYLKVKTHFIVLTTAGAINLGASFDSIENMEGEIGVRIQFSDRNEDYGRMTVRGDSLLSSAVSNSDLVAGTFITVEPA